MRLIAILTLLSIQLFARIAAKETCPLVLGHRGAPGVYPEDTVILTKFLFNFENTSSGQIPKPESTNPDFLKANLLFVLLNEFLFENRSRQENADDICFFL